MKAQLLFVLCVLFLTACRSTIHDPNKLSSGMSKAEVLAVMGQPQTTMSPGPGIEVLKYTLSKQRLYRLAVPLTTDYIVRLLDGRVEAYGTPKELTQEADTRERTVNLNIKSDQPVAPVQPNVNINPP